MRFLNVSLYPTVDKLTMGRCYILGIIVIIALVIYSNSLFNPFIWDDIPLVVENPYIKNVDNIIKIFTTDLFNFDYIKGNYYRPVQAITYMFDYAIWKLNPLGYHITNILLHIIVGYLIYIILMLITENRRLSLITSLFFLVHPIHTEVVTYISGRADSLVNVFLLSSLLFYIKHKISLGRKPYFILSLVFFILALLSKENAIILPFIIVFYDIYFPKDKKINFIKNRAHFYLPYFLILGLYAFLRINILNFSSRPILPLYGDFILLRLVTSIKSIVIYMGLLLFPFNLHMERILPLVNSVYGPTAITSIILVFLLLLFSIKLYKRYKFISFGFILFFLTLIPILGIFMPKKQIIMAEHWLYLPSIGFFIVLGVVFDKLIKINKKTTVIILILLLSFYSYLTIRQNTIWRNPEEFYKRIISFSPDSFKAHFNLGLIHEQKKEYDKAIEEYKIVQRIDPNYFPVHNNLGNLYIAMGMYDLAAKEFIQSLESNPDYFLTYNNLGNLYVLRQEYDRAIEEYKKSIRLNPYYSESHNNLGSTYLEIGKFEDAEKELKEALKLNPDNSEAYNNLGNLYGKKNLYDEAIIQYKQTIKLKPDFDKPYFNLGVIYFQKGMINEAKEEWLKTLKINPRHHGALNNLELLEDKK